MTLAAASVPQGPALASERHPRWTGRTRGGLVGNWIFVTVVRWLGLHCAYVLLVPVAAYFLVAARAARRASEQYRRRIDPAGGSWPAKMLWAFRHFYAFGQILLDRVAIIGGLAGRFRFQFEGEEHLVAALAGGRGAILLSAHCGNWEAAAHLLERVSPRVNVVAYEGEVAHVRRYFDKVLKDRSFSLIVVDGSAEASLAIMAALARGEVVALHGDRLPAGSEAHGVAVDFLGAPARLPAGPYLLAALSGAPLVQVFAMREAAYRYHFRAFPPEHLTLAERPRRPEQLREWAGRFARRLEQQLREHPEQWHNFYDFWAQAAPAAAGGARP
jgi:predicted LPLAT superfamily acyltransferase